MGVYWNPANASYYRSLEASARNVYLATQGTSGTPTVRTPTGINYVVDVPRGGGDSGCSNKVTASPELSAAEKAAQEKALETGKLDAKGQAGEQLAQGKPLSIVSIRQV